MQPVDRTEHPVPFRRRGKEWRERAAAALALGGAAPVFGACAVAIAVEGLLDPTARGPIFLREDRVSRGRVIRLLKFRTLTAPALASLGPGPTHIASLERQGQVTRVGRFLRQWYLDELPQLWNVVRGDMGLIGTRPFPVALYQRELAQGITRKRDMPAGLIGPVQANKGDPSAPDPNTAYRRGLELDAAYWEALQTLSGWDLFVLDLRILLRSARVQLEHKGI